MIRVLLVDDSSVQLELLNHILSKDPEIEIVAQAKNGEEAIEFVKKYKPNVVTMDIHMPKMNGIEATKQIMSVSPVPIVIICGCTETSEIVDTFKAFEAGAVAVSKKINFGQDNPEEFIELIKLMSGVSVVRRIQNLKKNNHTKKNHLKKNLEKKVDPVQIVAIGVSTGGPIVLKEIFEHLTGNFPPILVVQHIAPGFVVGLAQWLAEGTQKKIKVAEQGEFIRPNQIYLAPDGYQMGLKDAHTILLETPKTKEGHCPSVDFLFHSITDKQGKNAVGILLTGMGKDGAVGLKKMKEKGAYTIAQSPETTTIHGMPTEAIRLEAVSSISSPIEIAQYLNELNTSQ